MIGFILLPFIIVLIIHIARRINVYFIRNGFKYHKLLIILFVFFLISGLVSIILGFLIPSQSFFKRFFTKYGYYWLGITLYLIIGILLSILINFTIKGIKKGNFHKYKAIPLIFTIIFTTSFSIYGIYNAHNVKITNYELEIDKKSSINELNIAFISDLHLGYNVGLNEVHNMVIKINSIHPDIVLFGGDFFDNEYLAIENTDQIIEELNKIETRYGKYTVLGNHDIEEKIFMGFTFNLTKESKQHISINENMLSLLEKSNIQLLYDDYILINDIQIYGRPDKNKINLLNKTRLSPEETIKKLNNEQPIIIVDHEPSDYDSYSKMDTDLYLCGHTHDGQIFPLNLTSKLVWDNSAGYKKYNNMHNIVSSGIGLFGINMRTFTKAEICNIKIIFK